jgi:PAS domain S-box-containing protein
MGHERILILEDESNDAELIQIELQRGNVHFVSRLVDSQQTFTEALKEFSPTLILSDFRLPDFDAFKALELARQHCPETPFIVVSGVLGEEIAVETVQGGATDYVLKDRMFRLVPAVRRALKERELRFQQRQAEEALRESEANYRGIYENAIEGIFQTTPEGRYRSANPALARMLGYVSPEELMGCIKDISQQVCVNPESRLELKRRLHADGHVQEFENEIYCKDGSKKWVSINARIVRSPEGTALYYEGTSQDITGRKRAEQILRESEERFRQLAENIREVFWMTDPSKKEMIYISPGYEEIWGRTRESLYASPGNWLDAIHPKDRECVLEAALTKQTSGEYDEEYRIVRLDGSIRWINDRAFPIRDESGQVYRIVGIADDISGRKAAEEAARESQALKGAIMESALDAIITIDYEGKIVEFNSAAEKTFGCARSRAIGNEMAAVLIPPSLREWFQRGLTHLFGADEGPILGGRIEMTAQRADATEFPVELTMTRIGLDGPPMFTAFIRDITGRKRAEAQLATLAHAVETTTEPICITDLEDRFVFVNRAFQETYGYTEAEILGQSPAILFSPGNPAALRGEILAETRLGGWRGEVIDRRKDGTELPIFLSTSQIKDRKGEVIGLMGVAQDITERKRAEEQIRLLADAVQSTRELVSITDAKNCFTFVNKAFLEAYGYSEQEILGRTPEFLYSPNNPPELCRHIFQQTLQGSWRGELLNRKKDGTEFPISLSTSRIAGSQGEILGLVGVGRDISERKQAEKQGTAFALLGYRLSAAAAPEQAANIILAIASDLFGWDSGYIHLYSEKDNKILPVLTMDTINGKRTSILATSFEHDPSPLMSLVMSEGARLINRDDGTSIPTGLLPFGDSDRRSASMMYVPIRSGGAVQGILSIQSYAPQAYSPDDLKLLQTLADHCGDAFERIKVAEALREAEAKYRSIFENATEGIFQTTPDGRYLSANPALARMFGFRSPEELMSSISHIQRQTYLIPQQRVEFRRRMETEGSVEGFEVERFRKDGSKFWMSINGHVVRDSAGGVLYYEGTNQDITERKLAEEELRRLPQRIIEAQEAERLRVARDLHDGVNQILASARMRLSRAEEAIPALNPASKEILRRCGQLLVRALEENRRIAHNLRPSDLDDLGLAAACRNFCGEVQARTHLQIKCRITRVEQRWPRELELNLFRIVQEALNNIEKHAHAKSVRLQIAVQRGWLVLRIKDDGLGFITEAAKSGKRKGHGIGLTNMRERAASLGGSCEVKTAPKQGTSIIVRVPCGNGQ